MDNDFANPSPSKNSPLPLILGICGIVFGVIGLIFGMSAKSQISELEKKIKVIATSGSDAQKVRDKVDMMDGRIGGIANANNALAHQVGDIDKRLKGLIEETQTVLDKVTSEVAKNRELISGGAGRRTSSTARSTTTSSGSAGSAPVETPEGNVYTIQPGDTLSAIASRFGVSPWTKLVDANPGLNPNRLQVGQQIQLP